ncbi:pilus assembly protein [Candidatus Falkowbacteria bacterium]|nr:pilus assembly protein [Candidatus Falkowbacteria bacterium]
MKIFRILKRVEREEDGAVTVDWVVLTAAVVGLGIAALNVVRGGVGSLTNKIADELENDIITTAF